MLSSKNRLHGEVSVTVCDEYGNVKSFPRSFFRKLFRIPAKKMCFKHHNTITNQGDGLLADLMSCVPAQNKVDGTNGHIVVGTGWTGISAKANTGVNKIIGPYKKLEAGYPKLAGVFGSDGQNRVLYRVAFVPGDLAGDGINEVALMNGNSMAAKCLAYAQLKPAINMTAADTLQIDWQITVSGS